MSGKAFKRRRNKERRARKELEVTIEMEKILMSKEETYVLNGVEYKTEDLKKIIKKLY